VTTDTVGARQQICLVFSLLPGAEAQYDSRHRTAWPELIDELREAGLTGNTVYRMGTTVVITLSHPDDAAAALARVGASESARRWTEWFADLMATQPIEAMEVWRLEPAGTPSA